MVGISHNKAGSVNDISLGSLGLKGMLHTLSFSLFPNLTYFDLKNNSLNRRIPSKIGNFSKLKYFDLSTKNMSGNIPSEIGFLSSLTQLLLQENCLTGLIPTTIVNLHNLDHL